MASRIAVETYMSEIQKILKPDMTPEQLREASSYATALANNLYLDRSFEVSARVDAALAALTPAQVNAALRKYLKPESIDMVFAGDFQP